MMKRYAILFVFLIGAFIQSYGQDPQFSQYYASPLYLNPAFAGTGFAHRLALNSRVQWPSLPKAFVSHSLSWDVNSEKFNSGFGLLAVTDKAGTVGLQSTSVGLVYAYKFYLGKKWILSTGLDFSYSVRDLDFSKLVFGDQLEFGGSGVPTIDPAANSLKSTSFFDFDLGFLFYSDKIWLGMAADHVNEPNTSFIQDNNRLPMKVTVHGGMRIPLNTGLFASSRPTHIMPSFYYKRQAQYDQFDLGINYYYEPINIGIWYRGIPVQKFTGPQDESYLSHDALVFLIGFAAWNFEFNYSYDFTVSELGVNTNGAHEFSMVYQFKTKRFKKMKRKRKSVPCPAFYNNNLNLDSAPWGNSTKKKKN